MAARGFSFQSYLDAAEARTTATAADAASILVADMTCSNDNDLYNVVVAAIENAKLQVVASQGEALAEYLSERRDLARRALAASDGE